MRVFILAASMSMALATSAAFETTLSFKNLCDFPISLYDNRPEATTSILPGVIFAKTFNYEWNGMFRHGEKPQATLAEFTFAHTKPDPAFNGNWYDISIIPTGHGIGPGDCNSFESCRALTKDVGYNVPMQIAPLSNLDKNCVVVTCLEDGCDQAYKFPKDDENTHFCKPGTNFDITFCPGGTGGQTPAPTTPAPTIESGSMDALLDSGLTDGSGSADSNVTEVSVVPTPEPTTVAPVVIEATTTEGPAVEANTQSESTESSVTGTVFLVIGAVAAAAGVAMIVVIRRKKAALDAMEQKDSIALTTPSHVL